MPGTDDNWLKFVIKPERGGVSRKVSMSRRQLLQLLARSSARRRAASGSRRRSASARLLAVVEIQLAAVRLAEGRRRASSAMAWRFGVQLLLVRAASVPISTSFWRRCSVKFCTRDFALDLSASERRADLVPAAASYANLTVISAPPLKSMPYLSPPFSAMLRKPSHRQHQRGDDEGPLLAQKVEIRVLK